MVDRARAIFRIISLRAVSFLETYQFPECSRSNASLIFSSEKWCVINSSRSNSFDRYSSTSFGTLCFDFHPPNALPFHTRPVTNWNGLVLISCPAAATPIITDVPQPLWQDSNAALWKEFFTKRSFLLLFFSTIITFVYKTKKKSAVP